MKKEFEEHIGEKLDNGITLDHILAAEIKYRVTINILSLKEDGSADIVYLSRLDFKPMYINLYEKLCSYIVVMNVIEPLMIEGTSNVMQRSAEQKSEKSTSAVNSKQTTPFLKD